MLLIRGEKGNAMLDILMVFQNFTKGMVKLSAGMLERWYNLDNLSKQFDNLTYVILMNHLTPRVQLTVKSFLSHFALVTQINLYLHI